MNDLLFFIMSEMPLEEAVERAIEDCIRNNVLKDFLLKQRAEVFKMSIYEYDKERDFKLLREEERKYAREEVRDEVIKEVREEMRDKLIEEVRDEVREEMREEARRNTENERRNTERERQNAENERRKAELERQNAEREKENAIKAVVSLCCEYGRSREETVKKLMENCALTKEAAQEKTELYWDKSSKGGTQ